MCGKSAKVILISFMRDLVALEVHRSSDRFHLDTIK